MKITDCFETLSLNDKATISEVKQAYRNLAKKYHPDLNKDASREKFESIQEAYQTIQMYFQFERQYQKENAPVYDERLERIKKACQRKKEKQQQEEFLLFTSIQNFRNTKKFILSKIVVFLSLLLFVVIGIDRALPTIIVYEPVQGFYSPDKGRGFLQVMDRKIWLSKELARIASRYEHVLVEHTFLFKEVKNIYVTKDSYNRCFSTNSIFLDVTPGLMVFLILSLSMFIIKKDTTIYYTIIRYYNLYFLPLIIAYILLGGYRILYLLRLD